ncbi:alpha-L-fucosidase [Pedobacter sp. MC2016-14]|uniref:alpha-L-fucosidase n=1 Tax=Pedobacter sp. MC2016-14 TaxID=2897327 RepID=UPI001E5D1885|nr:alpha-L-fucosidase [Pedobacter sp. MC2016-14]MCD0490470.1 alpha-L-fucosidase [Pedobacter sp. MC2016-14]
MKTGNFNMIRTMVLAVIAGLCISITSYAQDTKKPTVSLREAQQDFVNLGFGMFIHYNIPTYMNDDWADPDASPSIFNPKKLNAEQWAKAAKSANMSYGCLTTKHHSGFAIWDTKTTDYSVMNSPYKKDVVREYVNAFRKQGLGVALYYSILDTHHKLRPGHITPVHIKMIKQQLTELMTNYGEIKALIIDGWDAPWSRISYDDVPFEEMYTLIKSLQPSCVVMDLNSAKYPAEALFYTDIKSYEQGAGQHISKESNRLPALACLPLQENWFWKESFPTTAVKSPEKMIKENALPYNQIYCNFLLNVAPNRDGLIDDNAIVALKEMGKLYQPVSSLPKFPEGPAPIISPNLAKFKPADGSWSDDMNIMDFGNDDNFGTSWSSNPSVKNPWFEIDLQKDQRFNTIVITERRPNINSYRLEYFSNGVWKPLTSGNETNKVKIHRFESVWGGKVRILIDGSKSNPSIAEFGVYNERRL